MFASHNIPRPEYPRPQMVRKEWINLNGEWQLEIDQSRSGRERELYRAGSLTERIMVPFCPESRLSGIGCKDFIAAVWYRRTFEIPGYWAGGRVLLHFGAVDYDAEVWVNGISAGKHRGGYSSFHFDITGLLQPGGNVVIVCAEDDLRSGLQPRGKQSFRYESKGAHYTRTTGIWQTVWLEHVPETYIASYRVVPDPDNACVHLELHVKGSVRGRMKLRADAEFGGGGVGSRAAVLSGPYCRLTLPLSEIRLWSCGEPLLYELQLTLLEGEHVADRVEGYFGLRTVTLGANAVLLNGKPVFQRLVLDQGYYRDGVYTAPDDEHLRKDIELALQLGFNGARLHQKIFEPRYLYWADRLGFLVWGEHASWGLDITGATGLERFLPEWNEAVQRDFNSPALVCWCPFNETWDRGGRKQDDEVLRTVYRVTKMIDPTRPVIDASGNFHVETDIFDVHDYEQNTEAFAAHYDVMLNGGEPYVPYADRQSYGGQPYMVSEYGGIWWNPESQQEQAWGYGKRPASEEEFLSRYEELTLTLLRNPRICGFCYTQLYDVEQEVNGLYTYERTAKFPPELIRRINMTQAAIEKQPNA